MAMNTHDYQPIAITENQLNALETWADHGMITAIQIQYIMDKCAEIITWMKNGVDNELISKTERWDRTLRSIATLDRLHEAVKLNAKRVKENEG